jgi:epoxide hydrolase-like predicted phosphatase
MTIKTILWDIGGVLERTEDHGPRTAIAEKVGLHPDELSHLVFGRPDNYRIQRGEISLEEHIRNIAAALEVNHEEMDTILEPFFGGDRLDKDLVEHIRALKQDYTTGVISNYMPPLRNKINDMWGIGDAFDTLVISSEVGVMKPDPEIYKIALERTQTSPEHAVFIDDFIENVEGARNLGMHAIHFKSPSQALDELHAMLEQK